MIDFTIHTQIARTPDEVFAYVTDPALLSSWQTNTVVAERLDSGPMQVGSRLREVHRAGGRELESVVEVSAYDHGRAFGLRMVEGSLPIHADLTLEPAGGGTLLAFRVHGQPAGAARIAQPVLRVVLKRQFRGYCETLKRILEAG